MLREEGVLLVLVDVEGRAVVRQVWVVVDGRGVGVEERGMGSEGVVWGWIRAGLGERERSRASRTRWEGRIRSNAGA